MWPGSDSLAGVMQQQRQIKDKRIGQLLEKLPIFKQFGIFRSRQRVGVVNADKRLFVRGIAGKKFMLHRPSKMAGPRDGLAAECEPVRQRKGPADFPSARVGLAKQSVYL